MPYSRPKRQRKPPQWLTTDNAEYRDEGETLIQNVLELGKEVQYEVDERSLASMMAFIARVEARYEKMVKARKDNMNVVNSAEVQRVNDPDKITLDSKSDELTKDPKMKPIDDPDATDPKSISEAERSIRKLAGWLKGLAPAAGDTC